MGEEASITKRENSPWSVHRVLSCWGSRRKASARNKKAFFIASNFNIKKMEAAGFEPASRGGDPRASTCLAPSFLIRPSSPEGAGLGRTIPLHLVPGIGGRFPEPPCSLSPAGSRREGCQQTAASLRQRERNRSHLFLCRLFYEVDGHLGMQPCSRCTPVESNRPLPYIL